MGTSRQGQFIYHDPTENSNKVWRYEILDDGTIHVYWGRVGATEQHDTVDSIYQLDKRITGKVRKGYRQVDLHVPSGTPSVLPGISPNTKEQKFVEWAFDAANVSIGTYLSSAVNALSMKQLDSARDILRDWSTSATFNQMRTIVVEYYRLIPTKLPHRIDVTDLVNNFDVAEQEDRLNQLEANLASYTPQGVQVQTGIFDTKLKLADAAIFNAFLGEYKKAQKHSRTIPQPSYMLQVRVPGEREAFEANLSPNPRLLFHGTRANFLLHILKSGLRRPTHAANGWRLGPGIYFAEDPVRSYQYTESHKGQKGMLVCEVRTGKSYEEPGTHTYNKPPAGYHSVRGTQSWSGIDEITVYDASQVTIRGVLVYT